MTSRLHNPSLMKGQGTEAAPSKTATVTDQTELDFFDCRNPSVFFHNSDGKSSYTEGHTPDPSRPEKAVLQVDSVQHKDDRCKALRDISPKTDLYYNTAHKNFLHN